MTIPILGIIFILLLLMIATILRFVVFKGDPKCFWKGIGVPLATPVLVALLGIMFSQLSETHNDNEKKVELLREVLASKDRPDIAFITAVGDHLVLHLKRRDRIITELRKSPNAENLKNAKIFEEGAAYFFYGMFHAALIDFRASKGYQLYPRLWMEEAFDRLADRVDTLASDKPDLHLDTVGIEEAALYKYFGAAAATFKTITDRAGEPTKSAILFNFNLILEGKVKSTHQDEYQERFESDLHKGYDNFQKRLNGQGSDPIHVEKLELAIAAITALDDYAFNKLFGTWYQGPDNPREVDSLTKGIPGKISRVPPDEYIFYPLRGWKKEDRKCLREKTWEIIFESVDSKFIDKGKSFQSPSRYPAECRLAA
jgi:hypothetical protein